MGFSLWTGSMSLIWGYSYPSGIDEGIDVFAGKVFETQWAQGLTAVF